MFQLTKNIGWPAMKIYGCYQQLYYAIVTIVVLKALSILIKIFIIVVEMINAV